MLQLSTLAPNSLSQTVEVTVPSWLQLIDLTKAKQWSPFQFRDNRRKASNFLSTELLVLDVDNSPYPTDIQFVEAFSNYKHIITTTKSHLIDKITKLPNNIRRYRVILQLETKVTDESVYRATYQAMLKQFPFCDSQTIDTARYFEPGVELISYQEFGNKVTLVTPIPVESRQNTQPNLARSGTIEVTMGRLSKATRDFLDSGAPDGQWNGRLFKAAVDANEQGLLQEAFVIQATAMAPYGYLTDSDMKTIESAYKREPRYEPRIDLTKYIEELDKPEVTKATFTDKLRRAGDLLLRPELFKGISTGYKEIDRRLGGGLMPHTLTGLSAPGKTGKTTLLTALTASIAKSGHKVGWLSLEMSPERHMIPSLLSIADGIDVRSLARDGDPVVSKLLEAVERGERHQWLNNIGFFNRMGQTPIDMIEDYIRTDHKERGTQIFFLDHVGYSLKDIQDFASHSQLAKTLRKLTDDLPIHIVAVVQPRNLQYGEKVSKATLYGGACWGQDLNQLLTLERKENDQLGLYLTDSHSPLAITSTENAIILTYSRQDCSVSE